MARRMPVPVYGLVAQRHLEDWDAFGVNTSTHDDVLDSCDVSISYTLWRNPEYIDDPVNLAAPAAPDGEPGTWFDEAVGRRHRAALRERPDWLLERLRRMRYPMLWECVTTHWCAPPRDEDSDSAGAGAGASAGSAGSAGSPRSAGSPGSASRPATVEEHLATHVNHVLANAFRETRLHGAAPGDLDSPVDERHVEHGVPLRVNGFWRPGIRIDTDPDVFGLGVALNPTTCITAVVPRDELRFIELGFATRRL